MPKKKRIADKNERLPSPMFDMGTMPYIEMLGNRRITVEGSTGVLLYDSENIKINISFFISVRRSFPKVSLLPVSP